MISKIKKEPSTAATAESPMEKIEIEDVNTSSKDDFNTSFPKCQVERDLIDDISEISALSDDVLTLLDDINGSFEIKAQNLDEQDEKLFFLCDYDLIACKLRSVIRTVSRINLMLDCILQLNTDNVIYEKKNTDRMFAFLKDQLKEANNDSKNK